MSRVVLTVLGVGAVLAGIAGAGVETPDNESDLRDEIRRLKAQVEKLESRLEAMESQEAQPGSVLNFTPPAAGNFYLPQAPLSFGAPHVPRNAERREFNGTPYYIIPINNTGGNAASPAR